MKIVAAIALLAAGCFTKPDRPSARDRDAGTDAGTDATVHGDLVPRLIGNAYWHYEPMPEGSDKMSAIGFSIPTDGIADGDLVLFIASIDNGCDGFWPDPIASGFTQISQKYYGNDGQTFVVAWKLANGEPPLYANTYSSGCGSSGDATISLVAIAGADPSAPIDISKTSYILGTKNGDATHVGMNPTVGSSPSLATTVDCTLVYASGADWQNHTSSYTAQPPNGFMPLTTIGDDGDTSFDWTSQQVAYKTQVPAGATGMISGSLTGVDPVNDIALPWTVVIAVAPAP